MRQRDFVSLVLSASVLGCGVEGAVLEAFSASARRLTPAGPVEVGFNAPEGAVDYLAADLVAFIETASVSIDAALYKLSHPDVAGALLAAHDRGVTVRMTSDTTHRHLADSGPVYAALEAAGIPIVYDNKTSDMHHKFLVRDRRWVWMGSYNPLEMPLTHAENALTIDSDDVAGAFTREFEEMFVEGKFSRKKADDTQHAFVVGGVDLRVYFAPKDHVEDQVVRAIRQAHHSIRFLSFSFSADPVADAMLERYAAGVEVLGAIDRLQVNKRGGEFKRLLLSGMDVRRTPFSTMMHHKLIIIDAGTPDAVVVTGSYNFTAKANRRNDESLVIVHSSTTAAMYVAAFDAVFEACSQLNGDSVDGEGLRITEVHANAVDERRGEFVEIFNGADQAASLEGLYLYDGDAFDRVIPYDGGGYEVGPRSVIVILDPDHAGVQPVAEGVRLFTVENGTLGNGLSTSDIVAIYGPDRTEAIDSFSFPSNPGNGKSIVRTATSAPDAAESWVAGTILYGTAGLYPEPAEDPWTEPIPDDQLVDVNTADAATLRTLSGIGPTAAGRIVADRAANGVFCTLDDLARVRGIGVRTIDRFRAQATVGTPAGCADPGQPTLINIDTATLVELDSLPGIGPSTAGRIIADRQANGPFVVPSAITRVRGIGNATYARLADLITAGV